MSKQILEEVVDIKGDPISIGDTIAYAVKTDKDESRDEPRRLVIRLAIVVGSHYGNTTIWTNEDADRRQLLLDIRRFDGRRSGQMKPVLGIDGRWMFDRVLVLSSDNEVLWRKRCADIVEGYINHVPGKDTDTDAVLRRVKEDILGEITSPFSPDKSVEGGGRYVMKKGSNSAVSRIKAGYSAAPVRETRYQKDKRKYRLQREEKEKVEGKRKRMVCPRKGCEWPLEEEGGDGSGSGVWQCMRPDCDYVEIVEPDA